MDAVEFETIENQKENIEPLTEGRSALALKSIFSTSQPELKKQQLAERTKIEEELESLEELDDPIQPFLDYIQWIKVNYPAGKTVESGLIPVLERCTSQFRDFDFYKNDPRYLKVWLTYAKYSDNPRDVFIYLARKEIGTSLALYYEEYANFLETNKRYIQAENVYQEGLYIKARPFLRLQKRYDEFKQRAQQFPTDHEEPQSPVFTIRSALSLKSGSLFGSQEGKLTQKKKLEIFTDTEAEPELRHDGWDSLGSSAFRNKENRLEAKPWAGESLKRIYSKKSNSNRVSVFQDGNDFPSGPVFKVIEVSGKKPEKVDFNFDLLYQEEEYCVQEVLARLRKVYKQKNQENYTPPRNVIPEVASIVPKHKEVNRDSTIHLNTDKTDFKRPTSPTATFFTNAAKDEVYSMLNQVLKTERKEKGLEEEDEEFVYDDYTEQLTRQNLNELTEKVSDVDLEKGLKPDHLQMNEALNENDLVMKELDNPNQLAVQKNPNDLEVDYPIVNPAEENLKDSLLKEITPPLSSYHGLYKYNDTLEMCLTLKKSLNTKQTKHVFLNLRGSESTFNLKSLLGEGGFASVYLAESMTGQYKAIKAQKPSSAWEFYILKQIEQRLSGKNILDSIISSDEIHLFKDESYLVLEYEKQGTILDIVNLYRSTGRNVDEVLVIFLTIEILKVIENLHNAGIMHGDLKPDNCMLRLEKGDVGVYSANGQDNWLKKGVKFIDFGRSIDMTLFPSNIRFKSSWKTDNQDCPEMRNNEPWTYQADYYGIAGIVHTLLYGSFIETTFVDGRFILSMPMKRYWHHDLWNPLFDLLINSTQYGMLPVTDGIRKQRVQLEGWLELHGASLHGIIRDIETGLK